MPLLAAAAVWLCTVMVLVVWSVMGGFLSMLIGSGRTVTGDVIIAWPNAGFPYYHDLIDRLQKEPLVDAAAPMIESFGMLSLPDGRLQHALIRGVDGPSYARVTKYADTLWWKPIARPLDKDTDGMDPRLHGLGRSSWEQVFQNGMTLTRRSEITGEPEAAIVPGVEVTGFNSRRPEGYYVPKVMEKRLPDGSTAELDQFLPRDGKILIHMAPLSATGKAVEMTSRTFPVANEFQSGVYEFDQEFVLMRLDAAQEMLRLNAAKRLEKRDGPTGGGPRVVAPGEETFDDPAEQLVDDPARVTHVIVKGKGDTATSEGSQALKAACRRVYGEFAAAHAGSVPGSGDIRIFTWEDKNRTMINAVQKETSLLLFLFMLISLVAVFLILAIFWSMVAEKTKDIGVLRAVGAGSAGIAGWWISYGLAIGLVGGVLGVAGAYLVVYNINPIHDWLGRQMGIVIWDPAIYYFFKIPNEVDPAKAAWVFAGAMMSSVLGAVVPALRAAYMDPVKALRFE